VKHPLLSALRLLDVSKRRVAVSITFGTLALGSAVALAAISAWLIARAAQMPSPAALAVAAVGVRAFGVGRGVLRYLERLASHDVALRGMTTLRARIYQSLASGPASAAAGLRRGDLLTRVGTDVDAVGDIVVRGLIPAGVATVLGIATSIAMSLFLPAAGLTLAACLAVAGIVAPIVAMRSAARTQERAAAARAQSAALALALIEQAGPLRVAGRVPAEVTALRTADRALAAAVDAGAGSAALAQAIGLAAQAVAVVAALWFGIPAVGDGRLTATDLAVIVLTPLAAFEATSVLPMAAVQLHKSRASAQRLLTLIAPGAGVGAQAAAGAGAQFALEAGANPHIGANTTSIPAITTTSSPDDLLVATGISAGWPGSAPVVVGLDLTVTPGHSIAIVGPSGTGKTTALLTIAGLLPRVAGSLAMSDPHPGVGAVVVAEDAHVFATTVLENLRVARGDVTPEDAIAALETTGMHAWLAALPDGLDTMLGPDGRTVSGGERRRLLLARALLSPAAVLCVDEPAEHLDAVTADALVTDLLTGAAGPDRGIVVVTHRLTPLAAADEIIMLADGAVVARGRHDDLMATNTGYRDAWTAESREDA